MEQEQELSRFQPLYKEELWPATGKFEALSQWPSLYINPEREDKDDENWQKV